MILVIADDLSGAAELAGIAATQGYTSEVHLELDPTSKAEFIAVDSRTRSLEPELAAERLTEIARVAKAMRPDWIYKKTDSVLRGNIRTELEALMNVLEKQRTLFIPANPGKQRCIREGNYFVNEVPLGDTVFATDPEYPQSTANVIEALGPGEAAIHSIRSEQAASEQGIVVPDVSSHEDITHRIGEVDEHTLAAGAAEFFTTLLSDRSNQSAISTKTPIETGQSLFICGSLAAWEQDIAGIAHQHGLRVFTITDSNFSLVDVTTELENKGGAMLAIGGADGSPEDLLNTLVAVAESITRNARLHHVFLEGCATASAFINRMNWTRFEVVPATLLGVGSLRPVGMIGAPLLFIKPGSYPWPKPIWEIACS